MSRANYKVETLQTRGGLGGLLRRLQAYRVDWRFSFVPSENEEYEPGIDRGVVDIEDDSANVISSELKQSTAYQVRKDGPGLERVRSHKVLLDIDYPAYLIESSTPNHHHLYLDVPKGVPHEKYMELLKLLGECGIIEKGFAEVSIARGHSDLRLPWVSKQDQVTSDNSGATDIVEASATVKSLEVSNMTKSALGDWSEL